MKTQLRHLRRGRRFTSDFGEGVLVMVNESRARVKLGTEVRSFTTAGGETVTIKAPRLVDWAPTTEVEVRP